MGNSLAVNEALAARSLLLFPLSLVMDSAESALSMAAVCKTNKVQIINDQTVAAETTITLAKCR